MPYSPSESAMWIEPIRRSRVKVPDDAIEAKYDQGEQRIVTEINREKLPNFVKSLEKPGHINVRPFYQRRLRWDKQRQSRLIESFIMNLPVPPLFLYERDFNRFEVMDGQQRITALAEYYDNSFALTGLESWPELNGRKYKALPPKIRDGLDRRSITSVVMLKESAPDEESAMLLKRIVFERLNTGGVKLGRQEIRNSLFQGPLNNTLLSLSELPDFRKAWGIPTVSRLSDGSPPLELMQNGMYSRMEDAELVLRFLALRHAKHLQGGMQGFLDRYMIRARVFTADDLSFLEGLFRRTISLCTDVYEGHVFRPFNPSTASWEKRPQKAFADCVMVGLSRHLPNEAVIRSRKSAVLDGTKQLFRDHSRTTFTGAANTRADVQNRIRLFRSMVTAVVEG
jgi:hypothetical protein